MSLEDQALQFALAARLTSYPDPRFDHWVGQLVQTGATGVPPGLIELAGVQGGLDVARGEFLGLFDHGADRIPLYETEYGRMRGMSKGPELADLNGFYRAFGLDAADGDERELADHLGVELEFYAVLLARQALLNEAGDAEGSQIVEDARRTFLVEHLGRFAPAIAQQKNVADSALYGPVFAWARTLVEAQCGALGAVPAPLDFHGLEPAPDEVCCAVAPPMPPKK